MKVFSFPVAFRLILLRISLFTYLFGLQAHIQVYIKASDKKLGLIGAYAVTTPSIPHFHQPTIQQPCLPRRLAFYQRLRRNK